MKPLELVKLHFQKKVRIQERRSKCLDEEKSNRSRNENNSHRGSGHTSFLTLPSEGGLGLAKKGTFLVINDGAKGLKSSFQKSFLTP